MNKQFYHLKLEELYAKAKEIEIHDNQRFVIFSDLHVGNGKYGDDFRPNAELFQTALHDYYYEKGYTLILNGDIEELHRYTLAEIRSTWKNLYSLFDAFDAENRLYKLSGNHDSKLFNLPGEPLRYKLYESLKLNYKGMTLFLFHGHQPSYFYEKFNEISGLLLRFIAKPLRIKHYSVAHDKSRRFKIEKRTYEFSIEKNIVSIIGHTHRPLFESLSKLDSLKYKIENLLRRYAKSGDEKQKILEKQIEEIKKEIDKSIITKGKEQAISSLYSSQTLAPSVFNSGCVIGKRGMTAIEIKGGKISLVHWFNEDVDEKYRKNDGKNTSQLDDTGFFRTVLKRDSLDYIFTKIRLLT
ncbi:metallophosphoesterase [Sediminispirochaeta bajacaliforniensis]|uniref:metallophosphoesterase n=1 Tax=Sediminispirochaeta bajacaliforniensis TaxID=148 RepID=UPI00037AF307|nr:metallophosphoesterase [Sediminispirochaeta bajacaliforniensis]